MKKMTNNWTTVLLAAPFALLAMACSGGDDTITAEDVTIEECNDLFGEMEDTTEEAEETEESEEMVEGDYNADGEADEEDEAIEERCEELMAEDAEEGASTEEEESAEAEE